MAFPTTPINTTNLDADTASPTQARQDLLQLAQDFNTVTQEANSPEGVLVLNIQGRVPGSRLPTSIAPTDTLVLEPSTGVVKVQDVLRLQQLSVAELQARTASVGGDLAYCIDGDAGMACVAVYDGATWQKVTLQGMISST